MCEKELECFFRSFSIPELWPILIGTLFQSNSVLEIKNKPKWFCWRVSVLYVLIFKLNFHQPHLQLLTQLFQLETNLMMPIPKIFNLATDHADESTVHANINKNILLLEMENYCDLMKSDAKLLMSGFYETDIPDIRAHGEQLGLVLEHQEVKNRWAMVVFNKPS